MSAVANRKRNMPDWEAFHYERISNAEFEITGGAVVMSGGVKRWPGPHDSLIINESEILDELKQTSVVESQAIPLSPIANALKTDAATSQFLQVVFALPEDEIGRQRILKAFHLHADFFGAKVLTCSLLS